MEAEWPLTDNVLLEDICISNLLHSGQFCTPLEWCRNVHNIFPRNTNPSAFQWNCSCLGCISSNHLKWLIGILYSHVHIIRSNYGLQLKVHVNTLTGKARDNLGQMMDDGWWMMGEAEIIGKCLRKQHNRFQPVSAAPLKALLGLRRPAKNGCKWLWEAEPGFEWKPSLLMTL